MIYLEAKLNKLNGDSVFLDILPLAVHLRFHTDTPGFSLFLSVLSRENPYRSPENPYPEAFPDHPAIRILFPIKAGFPFHSVRPMGARKVSPAGRRDEGEPAGHRTFNPAGF